MTRIFISHSHADEAIAYELVDFLIEALGLNSREIVCTSNPDLGLSYSSSSITDQLKKALINSEALIVLITSDSLHSAWIPFEAGSFWTTDKPIIPILGPGLTQNHLPGPLKSFLSIPIKDKDVEDKVNSATNQIAKKLNLYQAFTKRRKFKLQGFLAALKAWQSQRPATPDFQQEKEELQTAFQQEKEELKQSFQVKIRQLEQELTKARSQQEQLEEKIKKLKEEQLQTPVQSIAAKSFTEDLARVKLEMIAIPGGTFMMGSPEGKGYDHEKPQHEVTVQSFYLGKFPITQAQYQQVMGKNPSHFKGDDRPVEYVSWDDAAEFCQRLSEQIGKEYRPPTEAEWEYACRAGTTTKYSFGDETQKLANYNQNIGETTPVGQYKANSFGLFDMHGNIWEWCEDDWHDNYENAPIDGKAWLSDDNSIKVVRGGSWAGNPFNCRSASRGLYNRGDRYNLIGVRVVCVAPRTT